MNYQRLHTPIGTLRLAASETQLVKIEFQDQYGDDEQPETTNAVLEESTSQLTDYFNGYRQHFDLPLGARGTAFQLSVWRALAAIPYGETCSYADIARVIGNPAAVRAVGAANGRNPLPIVVPCHRVIGGDGRLTGFAGGLEAKSFLLQLEKQATAAH